MKKTIVLAGGCFWGVEAYYKRLKGVLDTQVGYTNGNKPNPTYQEVCDEIATHAEAVKIVYDDALITLEKLLEHMFRFIEPTSVNRQGHDEGIQYRTGVYYTDAQEKKTAENFLKAQQKNYKEPIAVEVKKLDGFYDAELYHQDYLDKNPKGYCHVNLNLVKKEERK